MGLTASLRLPRTIRPRTLDSIGVEKSEDVQGSVVCVIGGGGSGMVEMKITMGPILSFPSSLWVTKRAVLMTE